MSQPMIHHRTTDFQRIAERVDANLQKVFLTQCPVLTFSSSGTGAMEASVMGLLEPGDKVIAAFSGKFGERYRDIAVLHGLNVISIENEAGEVVQPNQIKEALGQHKDAKAVLMTLLETSTGVVHPIPDIAQLTGQSNAILMVDAISGLACDEMRMDEWGVDVVIGGSQKALMLPPGLAFLALSKRAQTYLNDENFKSYYFNLPAALKAWQKHDSAYTPAVSLIRGLDVTLKLILQEGLENVWKRHADIAQYVREEMKKNELKLFAKTPSNAVTSVVMPEGIASDEIIKSMRGDGIVVANGQAELKGKIVRFAHMGETANANASARGLASFQKALNEARVAHGQ